MPEIVTSDSGHAEGSQVNLGLFHGDKVLLDVMAQPHRMNVEIRDDHRVQNLYFLLAFNEEMIPDGRKCVQMATSG